MPIQRVIHLNNFIRTFLFYHKRTCYSTKITSTTVLDFYISIIHSHTLFLFGYTISDIDCKSIPCTYISNIGGLPHKNMKKNKDKTIFPQLNCPKNKTFFFLISQMVFFFFLASIGGFLWEVLIFLFKDGRFCNRGFLYGPWLPVYGTGAVLFYLLLGNPLRRISHSAPVKKHHPITIFFLTMLIGTLLELGIGYFLDAVWGLRYWDYGGYFLNYHGYICLASALGFGIAGTVWICFLSDFITRLWLKIPRPMRNIINIILLLIFAADCVAALIIPNAGKGITFSLSFSAKNA